MFLCSLACHIGKLNLRKFIQGHEQLYASSLGETKLYMTHITSCLRHVFLLRNPIISQGHRLFHQ